MGALPIAFVVGRTDRRGAHSRLVIVGGLSFRNTTLYITPVIYLWLESFQEHVLDRVPFLRSAHSRARIWRQTNSSRADRGWLRSTGNYLLVAQFPKNIELR